MTAHPWYPDPQSTPAASFAYACFLDEQPVYTCPWPLGALPTGIAEVQPAAGLTMCDARDLGLGEAFRSGPVAFTADPGALPYWLGREGHAAVQALMDGTAASLPERWRTLLVAAGLAIPSGDPRPWWPAPSIHPIEIRHPDSSAVLRNLVHPFHLGVLRLHVRRLLRMGKMRDGDGQSPLRWVKHAEPVAAWVHRHLAGRVSEAAGEPLKPSYVYTATYHDRAELPIHVDREQCRYTVSLCVDCLPELPGEIPWPLLLQPPGARIQVYQKLGDGLLFGGQNIAHGRPRMPAGLVFTTMLFHFVAADFDGSLT
ncbi:hypothetical protein V1634_26905 [Plantactinospora veratri]|uniref:Uncharacterized protein n=1 Tax=Plantactinospora veratri TaxID=1436122 RepID=A0ABU7SKI3_9ACTN